MVKVCISTPETKRPTGNFGTAFQWARIIGDELGHEVSVENGFAPDADVLVAIHAHKNSEAVHGFRKHKPEGSIILALAGTDIYPDPSERALESMRAAGRIVVLQSRAALKIPEQDRGKAVTILQSAEATCFGPPQERTLNPFDICVIGFMRDIKDPMRAALASRRLSEESKVRIRHAGGFLDPNYEELTALERRENPRYEWMGIISRQEIDVLLSQSQLMVLSSFHEGGSRVLSYAVVNHTPLLAALNDCTVSLLGESYPGLYPPGDTASLTALMHRAESNTGFLNELREITVSLAPQFAPEREVAAWKELLREHRAKRF